MPNATHVQTNSGRRQFLEPVLSRAVVGVAAQAGIELAMPAKLSAQTNLSPDKALQELLAGNQRFAANQLTPIEHDLTVEIIASLEYGVAVLGVRILLVLGHSSCGAVKAAIKSDTVPGQISALYAPLWKAVEQSEGKFR